MWRYLQRNALEFSPTLFCVLTFHSQWKYNQCEVVLFKYELLVISIGGTQILSIRASICQNVKPDINVNLLHATRDRSRAKSNEKHKTPVLTSANTKLLFLFVEADFLWPIYDKWISLFINGPTGFIGKCYCIYSFFFLFLFSIF